ncbi:MAG TPA: hypothetical protein VLQ65_12135 [Saliniramus sp.]|nr:hypothetical protein [Saliniramus sp.]
MTTLNTNVTNRFKFDDFLKTNVKRDDFANAMLLKDSSGQVTDAVTDSKIDKKDQKKTSNADYLAELFGKEPVTKEPVTKDPVTKDPVAGDALVKTDADSKIETGEAEDVAFFNEGDAVFFNEGDVIFDDQGDTLFVNDGDLLDEDGTVIDDQEVLDEELPLESTDLDNRLGTESYDVRDARESDTDANPIFDQHLRSDGDAIDLEHHDEVPDGPVYPNIGSTLTGPSGQISWGALHDKVVREAGDGWLEMDELTALGLSNSAARAILAGEQAVSAGVLMDTFAGEARLRGGMPVSITDFGIDQALSALIHADGPLQGSFEAYAVDGFIGKDDFIELASEAAAYMNEPAPSRASISQLFDEISGGDRRLSEFEFNNLIAATNADGSFSFEDAGLSIVEQLAVQGPPLTDRWFDNDRDTNRWRNDHGRPAYAFGSSNSIRIGEFRQAANNAMDWTGEFVSPRRVNEAYQTISSWDDRFGISQSESRWAFGSNPSAWDIIDGIRSNSTPRWDSSRWDAPRSDNTSWWRSNW